MPIQSLALFFFVAIAIGGVAWVFLYPLLSGERHTEKRVASVAKVEPVQRVVRNQRSRRDAVAETLKEFEDRHKKSKGRPSLSLRLQRAGLKFSKRRFMLLSAAIGIGCFVVGVVLGLGLLGGVGLAFVGAFGAPFWLLSFLKKRREVKFLDSFPDAVDIIVRGVKAGLPLLDCLKMVAVEAPEPLKSQFRSIVETQAIGMPLGQACLKLYDDMPVPEANFFGIVITIQQRAGGNLAEALSNLSRVLRDRKKMKAKIRAMSQEAKASAGIIGALPIAVMTLVYITSPNYMMLLFATRTGHLMLAGSAVWMFTGVMVMKKMINFDF